MRCSPIVFALVVSAAACSSAADPGVPDTVPGGVVVPAGVNDPLWAAVGKTCTPASPVTAIPQVRFDSVPLPRPGSFRTPDDDWADIARQVPGGFAGVILENGSPVIFLTDITQSQ